uniref:EF-hand domain-containing protein n=1 Tax=Gossypium raimondii TaxID=29730 RepID=A0A0D2V374_GOSRA|nr:hypothetical protein B456_010G019100 [Gossypium raimondii]
MPLVTYFDHIANSSSSKPVKLSPFANMPLYVPKSINLSLNEEQLKAVFRKHDVNGDGCLSKDELMKAFRELGSRNPSWRVRRSLHHADGNGDGTISLDELDELVKYVAKQGYGIN